MIMSAQLFVILRSAEGAVVIDSRSVPVAS